MADRSQHTPTPPRLFMVAIGDHDPTPFSARTRSAAVYKAFLSYSDVYDIRFGDFVKRARVRPCAITPANDGYGYVRRAYGVDPTLGQRVRLKNEGSSYDGREGTVVYPGPSTAHVHVMLDGQDHAVTVHPRNVELLAMAGAA